MVGKIILAVIILIIMYVAYRMYTLCRHPSEADGILDSMIAYPCYIITSVF